MGDARSRGLPAGRRASDREAALSEAAEMLEAATNAQRFPNAVAEGVRRMFGWEAAMLWA